MSCHVMSCQEATQELEPEVQPKTQQPLQLRNQGQRSSLSSDAILRGRGSSPHRSAELSQQRPQSWFPSMAIYVAKYGRMSRDSGKINSFAMSTSTKLVQAEDDSRLDRKDYHYSELVGSLLYLPVCTRPGISQAAAVALLARHKAKPSMEHGSVGKAVVRCIARWLCWHLELWHHIKACACTCDSSC